MGMGISSEVTKYDMGKGLASKNIAGIEGKQEKQDIIHHL